MTFMVLVETMTPKRYPYSKLFRAIYTFIGFTYSNIIDNGDNLQILLRRTNKTGRCPACNRRVRFSDDWYKRTVRDLDFVNKRCYLTFFENKIHCSCGFRGFEKLSFTRLYSRCSIRFEEYISKLCPKMTLKDISEIFKLDWKTVKDIDRFYTMKQLESLDKITPIWIGIDEVAYAKRHHYLTIIRDIFLDKVIWIGIGRKEDTLNQFFKLLGPKKCDKILLAVTDMWDPYIASISKNCPRVELVIDKFHILKKVNEALDKVRKEEFKNANDDVRKDMKRKRFIILSREKNLEKEQKEELDILKERNKTLYGAYLLKEQIADIFDENDEEKAISRLDIWIRNVIQSGLHPFIKFIDTLKRYFSGILNYFRFQVTNAGSEGFNNKINVIKRRAYGYRDLQYFILKIFQACGVMKS